MRYLEVFAGAGGMSLGFKRAGWTAVAHAEIEPHARAVLRQHWPEVPLHGDVTTVDWTPYAGRVDAVIGGSPCQDLSVAGKRAGLDGARSGLFYELIRAWGETGAPYCLWENVDGARSSNRGADFAAVLSALVGAAITVPADGWRSSGVAAGSTGVAAWRVLDLQFFGPPQRRRRVFVLAARAGGVDPAEVLALSEGVCGHPAPRERTREEAAGSAASGAGCGVALNISDGQPRLPDTMATLDKRSGGSGVGAQTSGAVLAFTPGNLARGAGASPNEVVQTLKADIGRGTSDQNPHVLAFHSTQDAISGSVSPAIGRTTKGMGVVCATGAVTHALTHEGADASEDGTGRGTPIVVDVDIAPTLDARDAKGPGNFHNGSLQATVFLAGRPRRLTPLECERLMGWPDEWTARGVDEQGRGYTLTNTARYRLCGNGVGAPVAEWIAHKLRDPSWATWRAENAAWVAAQVAQPVMP